MFDTFLWKQFQVHYVKSSDRMYRIILEFFSYAHVVLFPWKTELFIFCDTQENCFSMTQTANTINVSSDFFSYYRLTVTYRNAWKDLDNWNSNWKSLIPFWVFYSHIHCFDICFYVFGTYTYMYICYLNNSEGDFKYEINLSFNKNYWFVLSLSLSHEKFPF